MLGKAENEEASALAFAWVASALLSVPPECATLGAAAAVSTSAFPSPHAPNPFARCALSVAWVPYRSRTASASSVLPAPRASSLALTCARLNGFASACATSCFACSCTRSCRNSSSARWKARDPNVRSSWAPRTGHASCRKCCVPLSCSMKFRASGGCSATSASRCASCASISRSLISSSSWRSAANLDATSIDDCPFLPCALAAAVSDVTTVLPRGVATPETSPETRPPTLIPPPPP
mmetsp:Transcript_38802/g.85253  ORF Transcript_38802/g.85253 Transcript_38802/m.85253 type:complete len:238 (+) Transcript_38802:338-1051(+)